MKKYGEYLEESLAAEVKSEPKTAAAREARKLGLTYVGFGRYADRKGKVAYIVDNDRLVPFKGAVDLDRQYAKASQASAKPAKVGKDGKQAPNPMQDVKAQINAVSKRQSMDKKILKTKDKEIRAAAAELAKLYRPEMFDDAELQAIEEYTGSGYEYINRYLYKGHDEGVDADIADQIDQTINALDSAFEGTQAPFNFTVYSGLSNRYRAEKIVPGQEYVFRGYLSTSLSHDVAISGFADGAETVVLQIDVQKGQKAIYVDGMSQHDGELETMLPRGSKIKVISGPHTIPKDIIGDNQGYDDSVMNLFHCRLVEDK